MIIRFEESILRSVRRMIRALDIQSKYLAQRHRLTGPQLVCLRQIQRAEIITPGDLAKSVSVSQGTVTGILERLEARGLVSRTRDAGDRRRYRISLTPLGEETIASAPSPLQEEFIKRLAALPEGEQAMIDWVLSRVVDMMEASNLDAAPMLSTGPMLADHRRVVEYHETGEAIDREKPKPPGD
jgi:DNA-binding MarR family transcriptional regulator